MYSSSKFKIGDRVVVTGFTTDPSLNGMTAEVLDLITSYEAFVRDSEMIMGRKQSAHVSRELWYSAGGTPMEEKIIYCVLGLPVLHAVQSNGTRFYSDSINPVFLKKVYEPSTKTHGEIIQALRTGDSVI